MNNETTKYNDDFNIADIESLKLTEQSLNDQEYIDNYWKAFDKRKSSIYNE